MLLPDKSGALGWFAHVFFKFAAEGEVRRRIKDLAPGGGYILAPVHCIQPDVPPENICAMFDEAVVAGRYPLDNSFISSCDDRHTVK